MRNYSISDILMNAKVCKESSYVLAQNFGERKIRRLGRDSAKFDLVLPDDFPDCVIYEISNPTIEFEMGRQCINLKTRLAGKKGLAE